MESGRCLGLIGGLGVGATVHYCEKLVKAHEERGRRLDIVIAHAETSRVFEYVQLCKRDGLDAIILAGTDVTLLFNETNTAFPNVDCAALHIRAIADGLLGEPPTATR